MTKYVSADALINEGAIDWTSPETGKTYSLEPITSLQAGKISLNMSDDEKEDDAKRGMALIDGFILRGCRIPRLAPRDPVTGLRATDQQGNEIPAPDDLKEDQMLMFNKICEISGIEGADPEEAGKAVAALNQFQGSEKEGTPES